MSFRHKLLHLLSDVTISSQADVMANPFIGRDGALRDLLCHQHFVFLQHGVITQNLSVWLNRYKQNMSGFVTSASPESLVTNGTVSQRFDEIVQWPAELRHRLFMKMSFHYLEMQRLDWMERYFANVEKLKDAQVSFTIEITPSDELIPYIQDVKDTCMRHLGALCHVTIARDDRTKGIDVLSEHPFDEYKKIWGQFHSELFDFKTTIFYQKRGEFCYAGDWSVYLNLETGRLTQCYGCKEIDNIYADMDRPLRFEAVGYGCPLAHCYNGHAFLALGDIPKLKAPTYAEERNRVCEDGTEWLQPDMKAFMSNRLYDSNSEYSPMKKAKYRLRRTKAFGILRKNKRRILK